MPLWNHVCLLPRFEDKRITCLFEEARKITIESSVEVIGTTREEPRSPGGIELSTKEIKVIGLAEIFPITRDQSVQFLLDKRHLWLRSRKLTNVMQIRSLVFEAAREWFQLNDYIEVHGPMFITAAVEGGSTLFNMKYFDTDAYLTQSSQFYLETLIFSLHRFLRQDETAIFIRFPHFHSVFMFICVS